MRTRVYALLLLGALALAPLLTLGFLTSRRAEQAASDEVNTSGQRLAKVIGERVGAYLASERRLLVAIGAAALQANSSSAALALLEASQLDHPHFRAISVHRPDGTLLAGHKDKRRVALSLEVIRSHRSLPMKVAIADRNRGGAFSHTTTWADPVVVVGKTIGVVVSDVDLVGVWPPINAVQLGKTGFVRLLAGDGKLLAHGDPEERRFVFDPAIAAPPGRASPRDSNARNRQGQRIVSSSAAVPGTTWSVVVEQSVNEALRGAVAMKRDLAVLAAAAVLIVIVLGFVLARTFVRELERLQAHARLLAEGDLGVRIEPKTRVAEVRAMAVALNEMASSLANLQEQARARDRMATFARVAAGLAHDLRQPIETVRAACAQLNAKPDDPKTRERFERITARDLSRLGDYVGDLLQMARGGEVAVRLELVDPAALAQQVAAELSGTPKWRGIEFMSTGAADLVPMDRRLVHRALVNLASNGADACVQRAPTGVVRIEVVNLGADDESDVIALRVHDNGVGIPSDRIAGLLDGDFETTKRSTGIGLGLGIVRHVAIVHGGRLDVSSRLGEGSVFSLVIPRVQQL